jgi:hypothetical protein
LPSKLEALSTNPRTDKKGKNRTKNTAWLKSPSVLTAGSLQILEKNGPLLGLASSSR